MVEPSKNGNSDDKRVIFLTGVINEDKAEKTVTKILKLELENPLEPILLIVESYGGAIDSAWYIINTMDLSRCPIYTLVLGKAMSAGSFVFINGKKRFISKNSRLLFHQISGSVCGRTDDITVDAKEMQRMQKIFNERIVEKSKVTLKQLDDMIKTDKYVDAKECIKLGFADKILNDFGELGIKKL